ncbi:helix-turn-helix transcriptional regulator [Pseudomonas saponiphila]|uniref:Predicted transcriptional regulator YheO, contains PAS and DNA-binding HTH domains n=1 Tax=Pseudomonas saponiphila TaxID=556534 RepID=A0A1H4PGH1_9PSED|nr:PAS domain-containing protein [Pseudomonas saponiphila]SEC06358.1 Predicted transcriptional regulator YheO, contains PAS and DNA-binding HTH domains [Pseudomonas saponiphila]
MNQPCPSLLAERQLVLQVLRSTLQMLASVVGQHVEIVLHDLDRPESSIVAIANGHVTGRRVGDPVLGGPRQDLGFAAVARALQDRSASTPLVLENYPTLAPDGRELRSSTVVFRDSSGQPFASLCSNSDLSGIAAAHACLGQMLGLGSAPAPRREEAPDMEQLLAQIIQGACPGAATRMGKRHKLDAVRQMQERGVFIVKGGIEKAAAALGVTRYTIYNYLEQIRAEGAEE